MSFRRGGFVDASYVRLIRPLFIFWVSSVCLDLLEVSNRLTPLAKGSITSQATKSGIGQWAHTPLRRRMTVSELPLLKNHYKISQAV